MAKKDIHYKELAEHFYQLDTDVYAATGSELGKVFPGLKHVSVRQIEKRMINGDVDYIKNGLFLIMNMIQTLEGQKGYEELWARYESLRAEVEVFLEDDEKLREQIAKEMHAERYGLMYKEPDQHTVICIARETGSGGMEIGYRLAERLGFAFYNDTVLQMMMDEMNEKYYGISGKDLEYIKLGKVIEAAARTEDCVIVGRSSGHILQTHNIPRFSVFIGAPLEFRIHREMLLTHESRKKTEEMIRVSDKKRKTHYNYYTGKKWGNPADFDLCINSSCYGIEGTVDLLEDLVKQSLAHNRLEAEAKAAAEEEK